MIPGADTATGKPSEATKPSNRVGAGGWLRVIIGAILVFWFFLILAHLWRTDSALWNQGAGAPFGVFSYLAGPYSGSWGNLPLGPLVAGLLALAVYGLVGWLFLRSVDVYFNHLEAAALALLFGGGFCGLMFELLGTAHLLSRWPILVMIALLIGGFVTWMRLRESGPLETWTTRARGNLARRLEELDALEGGAISPYWRSGNVEAGQEGRIRLEAAAGLFTQAPEHRGLLRALWRRSFRSFLWPRHGFLPGDAPWAAALALIAILTFLTFYHALLFPETYWDSLILYLGYGRMTFLEEGFPFKAVAQVGIGLGANYPHLYSTHAAAVSAVMGSWSDVPARLYAPAAALAAAVLIYSTALRIWRNRLVAILCALVFRALPYQIAYSTYASDYALAMQFGAAFLFLAVCYIDSPLPGLLVLLTFVPSLAMHLNYLMVVLWGLWVVVLIVAHWPRPATAMDAVMAGDRPLRPESADEKDQEEKEPAGDPHFAVAWGVPGIFHLPRTARFWAVVIPAVLLGVFWNVRNWYMTGNPVYAFFPKIFDGIRINPEVLRSAEREWFLNGDGIGRLAEALPEMSALGQGEERKMVVTTAKDLGTTPTEVSVREPEEVPPRTFAERLKASWMYWVGFETFYYPGSGDRLVRGRWVDRLSHLLFDWRIPDEDRPLEAGGVWVEGKEGTPEGGQARVPRPQAGTAVLHWRHAYKLAPTTVGLALPGFLLWLVGMAVATLGRWRLRLSAPGLRTFDLEARAGAALAAFVLVFLAYHYLVADYYLYQILPIVVGIALFAGWLPAKLHAWWELRIARPVFIALFAVLFALVLATGVVPGVAMGLMGFKFTGAREFEGEPFSQMDLAAFRHPGLPPDVFWRLQYGADELAWEYLNTHLQNERLLTHENRDYCLDPTITLVHLDDWDIQKTYTMRSDRAKMALFRDLGIRYYLYVPNEDKDPINARVGLKAWEGTPLMKQVRRWGDNVLYRLEWSAAGLPSTPPMKPRALESYIPRYRWKGENP